MKLNRFDCRKINNEKLYRKSDYHKWIKVDKNGIVIDCSLNMTLEDFCSDDWTAIDHIVIGDVILDDEVIGFVIDQIDDDTYYIFDENGCVRKVKNYCVKKLGYDSDNVIACIIRNLKQISAKYNSN